MSAIVLIEFVIWQRSLSGSTWFLSGLDRTLRIIASNLRAHVTVVVVLLGKKNMQEISNFDFDALSGPRHH